MIASEKRDERAARGQLLLVGGMALVAAAAVWLTAGSHLFVLELVPIVGFTAAFFATRLLTIRLPQGDEVYVVAVVALSALSTTGIGVVLVASMSAGAIEVLARLSQSTPSLTRARVLDVVRGSAVIGILAPVQPLLRQIATASHPGDVLIGAVLILGGVYALIDILSVAMQQRIAGGLPILQGVAALQRPLATMYLVHISMAAVGVRLYAASGAWAFPITLLLTLILQNSFNLYLRIRRGYGDTISALAHAAELDRPQDSGHARRVSDLSVAVGRAMGLSSGELESVGYAALLHDIGRMGDVEGASAERGAAIAAGIPFLADVAPLIEAQASEGPGRPIGAEIVRACSRYDRLRMDMGAKAAVDALALEDPTLTDRVVGAVQTAVMGQAARTGVIR